MSNTLKFGNGEWATKDGSALAYNDENNNFKPLPFDFTRASSATVINRDGLIEKVGNNIPRIDFLGNTKGALLLEPSRTNIITNSEQYVDAPTGATNMDIFSGTITNNNTTSPNGNNKGMKFTISSGSGALLRIYQSDLSTSLDTSFSIYAKKGTTDNLSIAITGGTSTDVNLTDEWQRINVTDVSTTQKFIDVNMSGNTGEYLYIWGIQAEAASYATSYIKTEGSTVTRLADNCSQTVPDGVIGQTEGTIFLDFKVLSEDEVNANIFNTNKNTTNAISVIRLRNAQKIQVQTFFSSVNANYLATNTCDIGDRIKLAFKYKNGDVKLYINGILENSATPTFTISSPLSEINLADNVTYFARKEGINFTSLQLYNTALSDAELQALTR